jgi:SAM-dependent methyltransferase
LIGLGYTLPWLDRFAADAERRFAFMPAGQGATKWPLKGASRRLSSSRRNCRWSIPRSTASLLVHALEHAENPREMLMELWRVLAPGGRLVIVVPNRRGMWARFEHTPFGTGRPFSRGQITRCCARRTSPPAPGPTRCIFRRRRSAG